MNPEAVEWLESQPIKYHHGVMLAEDISETYADAICNGADMVGVIQTDFFDLKKDHEKSTEDGRCYICRQAMRDGTLSVSDYE